ncbi:general secretion pathway protein GspB [Photobacterium sanguinicancri]|uniref:General secretion pathway protein GspB n=1 Tax=Photobacterium sanguinicancri TaxID=875932 RepID=A0AAW7Y5H3_9GAMM|nr:general secretion pathway protein GspB [Photobacterium sanguinicancri]MDO6543637.1 general secretion pathway protein GspB [Photobacterium sanguinicancri]
MSKLFTAIAQSEQSYQAQSAPNTLAYAPEKAVPTSHRGWGSMALFALPIVAVLGYTVLWPHLTASGLFVASKAKESEHEAAVDAHLATMNTQHDVLSDVTFLPYPELITEALPDPNWNRPQSVAVSNTSHSPSESEARAALSEPRVISAEPRDPNRDGWGLESLDLSGLSPELAEQLRSAIAATDAHQGFDTASPSVDSSTLRATSERATTPPPSQQAAKVVMAIGDLPADVQQRLPTMNLQTHIYSSSAKSRWVKVNGREVFEGDVVAPGVTLHSIEPRQVVLDFEKYHIAMPALSEW